MARGQCRVCDHWFDESEFDFDNELCDAHSERCLRCGELRDDCDCNNSRGGFVSDHDFESMDDYKAYHAEIKWEWEREDRRLKMIEDDDE